MGQQEHVQRTQLETERREANLREELTKERDRQLEVLVDRLGREHVEQQRTIKKDSAALVDQVRAEGAEQATKLSVLLDESRAQIGAVETERALLQQTIQNFESKLEMEGKRLLEAESRTAQLEASNADQQKSRDKSLEMHKDEVSRLTAAKDRDTEALQKDLARLNARILEEKGRSEELMKEAK